MLRALTRYSSLQATCRPLAWNAFVFTKSHQLASSCAACCLVTFALWFLLLALAVRKGMLRHTRDCYFLVGFVAANGEVYILPFALRDLSTNNDPILSHHPKINPKPSRVHIGKPYSKAHTITPQLWVNHGKPIWPHLEQGRFATVRSFAAPSEACILNALSRLRTWPRRTFASLWQQGCAIGGPWANCSWRTNVVII